MTNLMPQNNGNQYGVLSTWEGTWFMKRGTDASSTLYISNCVKYNSTSISFFKALACIAELARHSPRFVSASPLQTVLSQGTHSSSFADLYRDVAPLQDLAQNTGPLHTIDASPNQTTSPHVSITISSAESLTHLARLLNQKPFTQGRPLCDILGRVLGYGRCGSVYECVIGGVLSAVKSIDPMKKRSEKSSHHAILRECNAYDTLSELQSVAIPRLIISTSYYNGMMLMATELGSEGVCKVMDEGRKNSALCSLRMIHAKGYIRGDIRKENVVFHLSNGVYKALWIDLETCRLGVTTEFDAEIRAVLTF
ncbi:hypothetical protein BCR33DRAFT_418229 [Rhizoclosmatium globosum]|uniref:Protein kinase domain-containing protein n=1 Tax=Rhizoclosmatium globosum TaxID=329046 RepID=A0A1Y2BYH3_9FUNG|nr:hypothetical protein BCR33DRAFT_418229 [Rhizoclosmatium globosum]|eukprot:ORY39115.1 hypothetical protein BCR33DRAFT_418229 [Rhizoclosmatium globosum]